MTRVGRVTEDLVWRSWAASRHDVAQLMCDSVDIIGQVAGAPGASLSLPQFERPFYGTEEFLENVDEREWLATPGFRVAVEAGEAADGLSIEITGRRDDRVELRLYGGRSLDRNAAQPELRHAVEKLRRPTRPMRGVLRLIEVGGGALVPLGLLVLLLVFIDELLHMGLVIVFAAILSGVLVASLLGVLVMAAVDDYASRVLPRIEFLPDNREAVWDRQRAGRRWLIGILIALVAAVAGVLALFK